MSEFAGEGWAAEGWMAPKVLARATIIAVVSLLACPWSHQDGRAAENGIGPIAGLTPDERPAEAPTVEKMTKGEAWYSNSLTGLSQPYPPSFRFLEDQGAWYTPFTRPGMTGPYDLRGWHNGQSGTGN